MICVPITETSAGGFLSAIEEVRPLADLIELRLDYLSDGELRKVLAALSYRPDALNLIFTFRPREQGGQRDLSIDDRVAFWRGLNPELVDNLAYADLELDLVERIAQEDPPIPWDKVICSHHDTTGTPHDLAGIFARLADTPASVVKIATKANQITDCLGILEIIDRAGSRPTIGLAMGMPGITARILALSRGAMLTFGSRRAGAESASGQPTVEELRDLYRVTSITRETEIYGVVGFPVGHSRSPAIQNARHAAAGRNAVYLPFEVEDLNRFMREMIHPRTRRIDWKLRGLSVTIPHKIAVMSHLDEIDSLAKKIGAVNTVAAREDRLIGYNTDIAGAMQPLDEVFDVRKARVAVIGAGGASRAVCYGLAERGAETTIYARDREKAEVLAEGFGAKAAQLEKFTGAEDVLINCTPIGMHGHSEGQSPVRPETLAGVKLVYDLVYTPEETALLKSAREAGCRTLGGLTMLFAQAEEQYRIWRE